MIAVSCDCPITISRCEVPDRPVVLPSEVREAQLDRTVVMGGHVGEEPGVDGVEVLVAWLRDPPSDHARGEAQHHDEHDRAREAEATILGAVVVVVCVVRVFCCAWPPDSPNSEGIGERHLVDVGQSYLGGYPPVARDRDVEAGRQVVPGPEIA